MMSESPVYMMSPPREDWQLRGRSNKISQSATIVNAYQAREEWTALANAIVAAGGDVLVLPPSPRENLTGLPYCAEAGEFYHDDAGTHFLLPSMSVEHRRAEAGWIGGFMEGLGIKTQQVGVTWEAQGDGIRTHDGRIIHTFGSGRFRRTEARAYGEVARLLSEDHMQLHFHADPWFHGNTFMNVYHGARLPDRLREDTNRTPLLLVACPDALLPGEFDRLQDFLSSAKVHKLSRRDSLNSDSNSLQVNGTVLASTTVTQTTVDAWLQFGLKVVKLSMDELYGKGGGAPVCLTNRLWGINTTKLPDHVLWSKQPSISAHTDV